VVWIKYLVELKVRDRLVANLPRSFKALKYVARRQLEEEEKPAIPAEVEERAEELLAEVEEAEVPAEIEPLVFPRSKEGILCLRERNIKGLLKEVGRVLRLRGYREAINHGVWRSGWHEVGDIMNRFDLGYVVGLFEGEGNISIVINTKSKNPMLSPRVEISNQDRNLLEKVKEILGFGQIYRGSKKSGMWRWNIQNLADVLRFCELIEPYLVSEKKRKLCLLVAEFCRSRLDMYEQVGNWKYCPYSERELELRELVLQVNDGHKWSKPYVPSPFMPMYQKLSPTIKYLRDKGHSLREIAKKLGISHHTVQNAIHFSRIHQARMDIPIQARQTSKGARRRLSSWDEGDGTTRC